MKNVFLVAAMFLVGSTSFGANMYCSVVLNNNPAAQISKDLKFLGAYSERFEILENSEFKVTIHASGGQFFGIEVDDKLNSSVLTTEGLRLTLVSANGIQYSERLRVLCISRE